MAQLRLDHGKFRDIGSEIVVIGPEKPDEFKAFWVRERMPFPGCPDPEHRVADLYGQEVHLLKLGRMPALFLIDRKGVVIFAHRGKSMSDIPSNRTVLALLEALNEKENPRSG